MSMNHFHKVDGDNMRKEKQTFWRHVIAQLRQWCYPPEFRIEAVSFSPELMTTLNEILSRIQSLVAVPEEDEKLLSIISELTIGLWRVRNRIRTLPDEGETVRRLKRVMEAVWEVMEGNGIKVKEHTGEEYDEGMALEVLDTQIDPSLDRAKVIETVKPSVFLNGRLIQWGVVIVGKPHDKGGD